MKVIETSNYFIDNYSETLRSPMNLNMTQAKRIAENLNEPLDSESPIWHIVVEDSRILDYGNPNK